MSTNLRRFSRFRKDKIQFPFPSCVSILPKVGCVFVRFLSKSLKVGPWLRPILTSSIWLCYVPTDIGRYRPTLARTNRNKQIHIGTSVSTSARTQHRYIFSTISASTSAQRRHTMSAWHQHAMSIHGIVAWHPSDLIGKCSWTQSCIERLKHRLRCRCNCYAYMILLCVFILSHF